MSNFPTKILIKKASAENENNPFGMPLSRFEEIVKRLLPNNGEIIRRGGLFLSTCLLVYLFVQLFSCLLAL